MKIPYIYIAKNAFMKLQSCKVAKLQSYRNAKQPLILSTLQLYNLFQYMSLAKNAFAIILIFTAATAYAQTGKNGLGDENVVIVSGYKPKLADAVKIDVVPVPDVVETKKPEIAYKTPAFIYNTKPYKVQLKAPSFTAPNKELLNSYAKLMFGNYADINGDFFYNTLRNRTNLFTIQAKHHSGKGPVSGSNFSQNMIDLYGKRIFSGHSITGNLGYKRNANRIYAINPEDSLIVKGDTTPKQRFNDIYFETKFGKVSADTGKFIYGANLGVYNFNDISKTSETGFKIGVSGVEPFRGSKIHADANYQFWKYKVLGSIIDSTINRGLFKLGAGYSFTTNGFRADVGFNTASDERFHFFPNAKIEADLIAKYLTVFGGITGNVHENTFRNFAYTNPFIISDPVLKNTTELLNLFGGAKGSFSSSSTFGLGISYKNYDYLPFFLNDSADNSRFQTVYDSNSTVINFHAEAGISIMENFTLGAAFNYNNYNLSSLAKAFHRPNLDAVLTGKYNFADKVTIGADLFFASTRYGGLWQKDTSGAVDKIVVKDYNLGNIIDLNTNVSYAFGNIKGLKAHLELKNILGTQYQLWNFYPSRGFQITGGASYSF